ncbi:MAG: stage II sporulation protein P [Dethiobacter sp.]|jgi:stage II sporulation protein P|nr:stage II sporulation protein P [Dethiobacter sp.]
MKNRTLRNLTLCFAVCLLIFSVTVAAVDLEDIFDEFEHKSDTVYTMVDGDGTVIMRTARRIHPGDEYINSDNNYYRVIAVEEGQATAQLVERVVLAAPGGSADEGWFARAERLLRNAIPVQRGGQARKIAIYNSHGAESYIKGDGTESKDPGGGIIDVGNSLAQSLEQKGIEVVRSEEPHTPHDAGAYQRSRRTAEEALKQGPDAMVDVHRDAVPEGEYLAEVQGQQRVQIQLVVGRQNQNMANNREFAEGLKKVADEKYPGLIKGIFLARGSYNQDMSPRATLIEVGSHTNDKGQAEESVDLFADVLSIYLYGTDEGGEFAGGPTTPGGPGGTALRAFLWLILVSIIAVAAYLMISTGGIEEMKQKLRQFKNKEFMNFLGAPSDKSEQDSSEETKEEQDDSGPEGS